jgi:hypothetical protein
VERREEVGSVCVCVYMCVCVYVCVCVYMCVCVCICVFACMRVWLVDGFLVVREGKSCCCHTTAERKEAGSVGCLSRLLDPCLVVLLAWSIIIIIILLNGPDCH